MSITKMLVGLAMAESVLSIGVSVTLFSGGNCESSTFIEPIFNMPEGVGGCVALDSGLKVPKSVSVATYDSPDISCPDGQYMVLQVWQSSKDCSNIPDASLGQLPTEPTSGGCVIMPVRSAKIACQQG